MTDDLIFNDAEIEELTRRLMRKFGLVKYFATLGDSDDTSTATIDEPGQPGIVRVRIENDDVPFRRVKSGLLGAYSPYAGCPVILGYDEKDDLAIEKADHDALREANVNPLVFNSGDSRISGFGQTDSLLPLLSGAVGTANTPSTEIFVNPLRYVDLDNIVHWFEGDQVDVVASIPAAGNHRYLAIFLNEDDTLETTTSTAKADVLPLDETDKQEAFDSRSARARAAGLWRLYGGQTNITNADRVEDLRNWQSNPPYKNNFAATVAPDSDNDIDENYEPGSQWVDTTNDLSYVNVDNTDGAAIWNNTSNAASIAVPIALTAYDAEPARGSESNIHGGLLSLATGQPLDSVPTDIVVTKGIGKVMVVINAGGDVTGDITVTGESIDRETGASTPADTDTLTVDALSTDNSDTDSNGNTRHSFTGAYITSKWFTGTVTLSTADLTLTDVDVYHVSFEQFNDHPAFTLRTFDANIFTTNVAAEFDAYLYSLEVTGDKCDITREASLNVGADGETAIANKYWRLRRGNIDTALVGTTDGIWIDVHYSNSPAYVEDVTIKVWADATVSLLP
jgi:hypothetical protein